MGAEGEGGEGEHAEGGEEGGDCIGRGDTTDATICAVRVEVHLSGGTELGPTERQDLGAGGSGEVVLSAGGEDVESWTAHPETSACG